VSVVKVAFADWADTLRAVDELVAYMALDDGAGLSLWARSANGETFQTQVAPDAVVESVAAKFAKAEFWEREIHQMFGVEFDRVESNRHLYAGIGQWLEAKPLQPQRGLAKRNVNPWPGAKEPGESNTPGKRRLLPPGVDTKFVEEELL
jgi:NADH-quinone oxidoreductase subunit C